MAYTKNKQRFAATQPRLLSPSLEDFIETINQARTARSSEVPEPSESAASAQVNPRARLFNTEAEYVKDLHQQILREIAATGASEVPNAGETAASAPAEAEAQAQTPVPAPPAAAAQKEPKKLRKRDRVRHRLRKTAEKCRPVLRALKKTVIVVTAAIGGLVCAAVLIGLGALAAALALALSPILFALGALWLVVYCPVYSVITVLEYI
ncbi:hypothetical protein BJY00DRAFT_313807 [Aspergillus carlsbadensis]|nr:hypothetical protein BJY00DRAFT_313807 [Aspergillus carlsbadensis]